MKKCYNYQIKEMNERGVFFFQESLGFGKK
jgi:hypothetical protein